MCWSFSVSVCTGAAAWAVAGYLIKRNIRWDRSSALFLMAVSSMQFADAFLWWDGMDPQKECSTTNWVTSVIAIPLILRAQILLRQTELRFTALPNSVAALFLAISIGIPTFSGPWAPSAAVHYFANRSCSTASLVEHSSPLWGGINMPIFCFIIYFCFTIPPMIMTGRTPESCMFISILAVALSFEDAWSSKFCSLACSLSIWYLFYSGPALPAHALEHMVPEKELSLSKRALHSYERFCYGTAKK